jgi:hypothetical protein
MEAAQALVPAVAKSVTKLVENIGCMCAVEAQYTPADASKALPAPM